MMYIQSGVKEKLQKVHLWQATIQVAGTWNGLKL